MTAFDLNLQQLAVTTVQLVCSVKVIRFSCSTPSFKPMQRPLLGETAYSVTCSIQLNHPCKV